MHGRHLEATRAPHPSGAPAAGSFNRSAGAHCDDMICYIAGQEAARRAVAISRQHGYTGPNADVLFEQGRRRGFTGQRQVGGLLESLSAILLGRGGAHLGGCLDGHCPSRAQSRMPMPSGQPSVSRMHANSVAGMPGGSY